PDKMLAVICGAVNKAYTAAMESIMEYKRFLEKGQSPSRDILRTVFIIDFIYENVHYKFTATRSASDSFTLLLEWIKGVSFCSMVENDPTQLRSLSPGKLVKFLVESGDH
ncbi:16148_t:CDS:2, partial [Funneliformis geosporum]